MFKTIKKAALSADEFATIIGVSRVAVFNWRAGRSKPHPQLRDKVQLAEEFLEQLLERSKLPLPPGLDRDQRKEKIARLKEIFKTYRANR